MALHAYQGDSVVRVFDEPLAFPLPFEEPDSQVFAIALSVARQSRERPANEEIARFSTAVASRWYVFDPFDRAEYFGNVFPQLVQQALEADQRIHFNLTGIQRYHETTLRELDAIVRDAAAFGSTTFYEWTGEQYTAIDPESCRPKIVLLQDMLPA